MKGLLVGLLMAFPVFASDNFENVSIHLLKSEKFISCTIKLAETLTNKNGDFFLVGGAVMQNSPLPEAVVKVLRNEFMTENVVTKKRKRIYLTFASTVSEGWKLYGDNHGIGYYTKAMSTTSQVFEGRGLYLGDIDLSSCEPE